MNLGSLRRGTVARSLFVLTVLVGVVGNIRAHEVTALVDPGYVVYVPEGDSKSIYLRVDYEGVTLEELMIEVDLPGGFSFLSVTNYTPVETTPDSLPAPRATGTLEFAYTSIPGRSEGGDPKGSNANYKDSSGAIRRGQTQIIKIPRA